MHVAPSFQYEIMDTTLSHYLTGIFMMCGPLRGRCPTPDMLAKKSSSFWDCHFCDGDAVAEVNTLLLCVENRGCV